MRPRKCSRATGRLGQSTTPRATKEKSRAQLEKTNRTGQRTGKPRRAEGPLESARADLNRREEFSRRIGPSADGRATPTSICTKPGPMADATRDLPWCVTAPPCDGTSRCGLRAALDRAVAARQRPNAEAAEARAALSVVCGTAAGSPEKVATSRHGLTTSGPIRPNTRQKKERRVVNKDGEPPAKGGPGGHSRQAPRCRPLDLRLELPRDKMGRHAADRPGTAPESILDSLDETPAHRGPAAGRPAPTAAPWRPVWQTSRPICRRRKRRTRPAARELHRRQRRGGASIAARRKAPTLPPGGEPRCRGEAAIRRQAKKLPTLNSKWTTPNVSWKAATGVAVRPAVRGLPCLLPAGRSLPAARLCNDMARQQGGDPPAAGQGG